jgi:hypothetical protein
MGRSVVGEDRAPIVERALIVVLVDDNDDGISAEVLGTVRHHPWLRDDDCDPAAK